MLAFPCNQFGGQEPGGASEIRATADRYGVTFPMFAKIDVNGENTHPVYRILKAQKGDFKGLVTDIKWNFAKFLVGPDGQVVNRYLPTTSPSSIESDILKLLDKQEL